MNVKLAQQTVILMLFVPTPLAVSPAHAEGDTKEMGRRALVRADPHSIYLQVCATEDCRMLAAVKQNCAH